MSTPVGLFDYDLPGEFIAQSSVEPRDHSRLMILDRNTGEIRHARFDSIIEELMPGDVLVFNTSKVFKARLMGSDASSFPRRRSGGGHAFELFVLRIRDGEVEALIKPGRKFRIGDIINVADHEFKVAEKHDDGVTILKTGLTSAEMLAFCDTHGEIPTPPYVSTSIKDPSQYQTVYAKEVGSVAAPTAGFHFTPELLEKIKAKGVQVEYVILHVGIGTFRPVKTETLEEHEMHSEWVSLSPETAERINKAKAEGRRVIAVGTTTTRVLEGIGALPLFPRGGYGGVDGPLRVYEGEINIFITPGFEFKVIDGLITNFHLPKSTLLVLVSAFSTREHILNAYEEAKKNGYRFFSFGDAMFIR